LKHPPQITAAAAAGLVKDDDVLMAGGFAMTRDPVHLLHALAEADVRRRTGGGNSAGEAGLRGGRCTHRCARRGPFRHAGLSGHRSGDRLGHVVADRAAQPLLPSLCR
jgi:acyl CoA:acetate/3-ketoacid CoA transferase alpha subunit